MMPMIGLCPVSNPADFRGTQPFHQMIDGHSPALTGNRPARGARAEARERQRERGERFRRALIMAY
jgi:hypothetical protein